MATKLNIVWTRAINDRIADDSAFASMVGKSLSRFAHGDWGTVCDEDKAANTHDWENLANGKYGRILAAYDTPVRNVPHNELYEYGEPGDKIWIIRDTEQITVLYPSEY